MLQARTCGGEEGLNELWFAEFGEESEGIASNVFVGMLQIVANAVTTGENLSDRKDHLAMARGILTKPGSSLA
jgi:hypothetical protein